MQAIETTAIFNEIGELKIDNLPVIKNKRVKLLILLEEDDKTEWNRFSEQGLSAAYSDDEPAYTPDVLKEQNPDYKP